MARSLIDTKILNGIRSTITADFFDKSAVLFSQALVSDGAGGWTEGQTNMGTVSCRVDPLLRTNQQTDAIAMREGFRIIYRLMVPYDTTIEPEYKVAVDSITYDVVQLDDDHSNRVWISAIIGVPD